MNGIRGLVDMDVTSAIEGGLGAIVGAVSTLFVMKHRVERTEADILSMRSEMARLIAELKSEVSSVVIDVKKSVDRLSKNVVYDDTCGVCREGSNSKIELLDKSISSLDKKIDIVIDRLSRRREDHNG